MKEALVGIGIGLFFLGIIIFIGSLFSLIFIKDSRKMALKLLIISLITAIIGFGTCAANFSLGGMH